MAELVLTEQEKAAESWYDLDDEALGRVVKKYIEIVRDVCRKDQSRRTVDGEPALLVASAALLIGMEMDKENVGEFDLEIERTYGSDEIPNGILRLSVVIDRDAPPQTESEA